MFEEKLGVMKFLISLRSWNMGFGQAQRFHAKSGSKEWQQKHTCFIQSNFLTRARRTYIAGTLKTSTQKSKFVPEHFNVPFC